MATFDLWTPEFCLGCDRQTDGTAYCSEACKLAEYEQTPSSSPNSSAPSSPCLSSAPLNPWTWQRTSSVVASPSALQLTPAFDFDAYTSCRNMSRAQTEQLLTPSSSCSSLFSIQTTTSIAQSQASTDPVALSERASKELRKYAISFEHVKLQRRRSY